MQLGFQAFLSLASVPSVKWQNILACLSPVESDHSHYRWLWSLDAAFGSLSFCSLFLPPLSACGCASLLFSPLFFIFCPALPHSLPLLTSFCSFSSLLFVVSQPVVGTITWEPCWLWTHALLGLGGMTKFISQYFSKRFYGIGVFFFMHIQVFTSAATKDSFFND